MAKSGFGKAFAAARKEKGAGKTFMYNGKSYSTNLKEEEKAQPKATTKKPPTSGKSVATGKARELYEANLKAVTDPKGRKAPVTKDNISKMANAALNKKSK
jgi:hypothetical protein